MKRVALVVFDGFQLLDLAGPADVFDVANQVVGRNSRAYSVEVLSSLGGAVVASNGVALTTAGFADAATQQVHSGSRSNRRDTLIVVGGWPVARSPIDPRLVNAVKALARQSRRVASVCSGAFVLAEAGLLSQRRATTHWVVAEKLERRYPDVEVEADAIYVRDGNVWTSAGVTAGIDLALAMVGDDHGHEVARQVASGLVVYLHRPGGQSQFSTPMATAAPRREGLRELQAYIDAHPADDLSVAALARRVSMSPRHFSRVFTQQTGMPPGQYVERSRAQAARRLLELTDDAQDRIARASGLGTPETLYRVFRRHWRVAPGDYRRRFRTLAEEAH